MDQDVDLVYVVTIRTYGDLDKVKRDMLSRLTKICDLNFMSVSVEHDHARRIDRTNYKAVS